MELAIAIKWSPPRRPHLVSQAASRSAASLSDRSLTPEPIPLSTKARVPVAQVVAAPLPPDSRLE